MSTNRNETSQIFDLWRFHSGQMWSRLQTASAIEVGVITGWYTIRCQSPEIATTVLSAGAFLLIITGLLMRRDAQYMTACEKTLKSTFPKPEKPFLGLSGRTLAFSILILLALGDIVLAVYQLSIKLACS